MFCGLSAGMMTEESDLSVFFAAMRSRHQPVAGALDEYPERGKVIIPKIADVEDRQIQKLNDGEHGFVRLGKGDAFALERVQNVLAEYGTVCLDNTSTEIYRGDEYIRLCGLCYTAEYYRGVRQYKRGWKAFMLTDMIDFIGIKQPDEFTLLLAHNPLDFDVHAEWGADVSFGGHIHGGFIRLPVVKGLVSPERKLFPKYKEGVYRVGNSTLVVSRGLGNIRINNPPEIVSVTLNCDKGD